MSKLKEKKDIKMTIFIIVVGVSLMVAGIYGVVSSRIESRDYKNSTDIQKISAVIIDFSTSNSKDDSGDVKYTTYKFKVSYVPYKIGKLQIQGFSESTTPTKTKQSYHITQKAARSRPRAAFLRGRLGRRQDFSKK